LLAARKVAVRVPKSWNYKSSLQIDDFDGTSRLSVRKDSVDSVERRTLKLFSCKPLAVYEGFCRRTRMWRANFRHYDRKRGLQETKQEEKAFHLDSPSTAKGEELHSILEAALPPHTVAV